MVALAVAESCCCVRVWVWRRCLQKFYLAALQDYVIREREKVESEAAAQYGYQRI